MSKSHHILPALLTLIIITACSTTSNLPDDEYLYDGIKKVNIEGDKSAEFNSLAITEMKAALAYAPNNSFMGSSYYRFPLPIGLWIHNNLVNKERNGFENWVYNSFGRTPVTISAVNPATRARVAENTLKNYGYFNAEVTHQLVDQKDAKKKKISYDVKLGDAYHLDSVKYGFRGLEDSILQANWDQRKFKRDDQFNVTLLEEERQRIVNDFRNNGLFNYRPEYITYLADSIKTPKKVWLVVVPDLATPENAHRQYTIGDLTMAIRQSGQYQQLTDTFRRRTLTILYNGDHLPISPMALFRNMSFRRGQLFSQQKFDTSLRGITNMGLFRNVQFSYTPRDTTDTCSIIDIRLDATMDKLIDSEFSFNITQKSNSQVGPNAKWSITKRNAFRHAETFKISLMGAYEWQTGKRRRNNDGTKIDSYEWGIETSLTYPRIMFPWLNRRVLRYPATTTFKFSIDQLRRSGYYNLLSMNTSVNYFIHGSRYISHSITPFMLTQNKLMSSSEKFDSIANKNQALFVTVRDQLIPAMQYTYRFDNTFSKNKWATTIFEASVKEAGNVTSAVSLLFGKKFEERDKMLLRTPYSQFTKLTFDLRRYYYITEHSLIALRFLTGAIWSYGNSTIAPYTEQFYVGGANDIRAFTVRSIGPGRYYDYENKGTYLDQAGDFKLEFNAEYRFRWVSNLYGAVFLDAGNVWLMRADDFHPGGEITRSKFFKDVALGTGFGIRYDMEFLILRLDWGIGIHAPYDTGKRGYYNIPKFWKGTGIHFAVGYPF